MHCASFNHKFCFLTRRRKFHIRISEQEEQIESLMAKCTALEKQKSRLQSEVEVLIIDLEKVRLNYEIYYPNFLIKDALIL